jgi:hypothetical protein
MEVFKGKVRSAVAENGVFTLDDLRDTLGYGRRIGVIVLEYLDSIGLTSRSGEGRILRETISQSQEEKVMRQDSRKMWESLGFDLPAHDALLEPLGKRYKDIFMSQENRPKGMSYFDFMISEVHGLRVKEPLDEKAAGRKVVGSFCVFVPEEIVRAVDATLVGLCTGADFATEEVEKLLPPNTCTAEDSFPTTGIGFPNLTIRQGQLIFLAFL